MRIKHKNKSIFLDRDGTLIKAIKKSKFKYRPPYNKKELKISPKGQNIYNTLNIGDYIKLIKK